jgi:hypothetical protein
VRIADADRDGGRVDADVAGAAGWRALWTDDEPPAVVVFCQACAEREFGD